MNIGIVGGGIAGLTAAYRLGQAGHIVTVYEAGPEVGGQARTFPIAGTRLEIFYHHLFAGDREILAAGGGRVPPPRCPSMSIGGNHRRFGLPPRFKKG